MEPQTLARLLAVARIGIGAALMVAPDRVLGPWLGKDGRTEGARVLGQAMGIRDLVVGAGQLGALVRGDGARPWLRAGAACDLVDLAATVRAREHIPLYGVVSTSLVAATGAAAGTWLQTAVD
jgi:hypothetical protein